MILLNIDIVGYHWLQPRTLSPNIRSLQLKKVLRSCKNPLPDCPWLKYLQHLFHLKSLTLRVENGLSMRSASKVIRKLRSLQSLHVKYISDHDKWDPNFPIPLRPRPDYSKPVNINWGFFYKVSKLPRLKTFTLQTLLKTLKEQPFVVQKDFAEFYLKSQTFKIETQVFANTSLGPKDVTAKNMASILKTADSLSLWMGIPKPAAKKNPYICKDPQGAKLSEEENKKVLKQGNRPVKLHILYKAKIQINIGCLLANCENLVSLYLKISGIEVIWDQDYGDLLGKLHTMVLDVDFLGLRYEILDDRNPARFKIEEEIYEVSPQRKVKFHCGLLELLNQVKKRAKGLEEFILFMCLANFKKTWIQGRSFKLLLKKMLEVFERTRVF